MKLANDEIAELTMRVRPVKISDGIQHLSNGHFA
jgi:hypothetical protein